jgi:DNA helicase-2/ATP-dependent DNA helicase PcrA
MEFDHVIMPYLEEGQFPDLQCERGQEENLFYVGITRARHVLTLLVPESPRRRSSFIDRMDPDQSNRDGEQALKDHVEEQGNSRIDLRVPFEEKNLVKKLGARWDAVRRVWYIDAGVDPKPFGPWLIS